MTDDLGLLDDPERPSFFADAEYGPCSMLNIFLALSMLLLFAGLAFFWDDCSEEDDEERQAMALFAFLVLSWFVDERVDGSPLFRDAKESVLERRRKIILKHLYTTFFYQDCRYDTFHQKINSHLLQCWDIYDTGQCVHSIN